jgi:UDP-N-acetylmuramate dehydrogenase
MTTLEIQHDVPLAPLTTFELGGRAKHFARVHDEPTLVAALRWAADQGLRSAILGGGSNLIVPDEGYPGLVVQMALGDLEFVPGGRVIAGAGVHWTAVVDGAVSRAWAGLECLAGIPGLAGATPIQNVGAYGREVAEVITEVRVLRRDTLTFESLAPAECAFGYRTSLFKRDPERFVVSSVCFALRPGGPGSLRYAELEKAVAAGASLDEIRRAVLALRRKKSMVLDPDDPNRRSAGSFFLNPVVSASDADHIAEQVVREGLVVSPDLLPRYPTPDGRVKLAAGWLIEKAGFEKGTRRGAVGLSTRHTLALVHHGGGTSSELLAFANEIHDRVSERFGVELEREPRLLA